ncbi:hypothetical protein BD408DRAFT_435736 [Parasitella parasitica]|nr:hypothetical protein BD408DRAFT_435736 [Parasitella parasitica]
METNSTSVISSEGKEIKKLILATPYWTTQHWFLMILHDDTNEFELISWYTDPFLCGLFDDPDHGMFLRWTNEIILEARKDDCLATNGEVKSAATFFFYA